MSMDDGSTFIQPSSGSPPVRNSGPLCIPCAPVRLAPQPSLRPAPSTLTTGCAWQALMRRLPTTPPEQMPSPSRDPGDSPYATTPRHLAGPGDPRLVIQPLVAAGWTNRSDPDTAHLIYICPNGEFTVALSPVPSPAAPWWHITGTHNGQTWSASFGGNTPVEILAEFSDALLKPVPETAAEVWPLLTAAGWQYDRDEQGTEAAQHPSMSLVMCRHMEAPGELSFSWTAEAAVHLGTYFWSAELEGSVPPHLVAAFATALARDDPVPRAKGAVPDSYFVTQTRDEPQDTRRSSVGRLDSPPTAAAHPKAPPIAGASPPTGARQSR
ncbi:DUF317 domain-containing protein [Streptomyces collinus]|uniref:DUF317 domain-containing protein n=1 Tax=Streptomyces collinus TaxID=42684 RepID=UPI0037D59FD9